MACQEGGREVIRVTGLSRVRTKDECVWGFLISEKAMRGKREFTKSTSSTPLIKTCHICKHVVDPSSSEQQSETLQEI